MVFLDASKPSTGANVLLWDLHCVYILFVTKSNTILEKTATYSLVSVEEENVMPSALSNTVPACSASPETGSVDSGRTTETRCQR